MIETLSRFNNPTKGLIRIRTDEVSALCPFNFGVRDYYRVIIIYRPKSHCVELKSLKQYFEAFGSEKLTHEELAERIYQDLHCLLEPESLNIIVKPNIRGGITTTVFRGDRDG